MSWKTQVLPLRVGMGRGSRSEDRAQSPSFKTQSRYVTYVCKPHDTRNSGDHIGG